MPFWRKNHPANLMIAMSLRAAGSGKRVLLCRLRDAGSMTVEAAFVLPLFLFFMAEILTVFDMIRLQSGMLAALREAGTQITEYCYYYRSGLGGLLDLEAGDETYSGETGGDLGLAEIAGSFLLSETWLRSRVEQALGEEYLNHTCLEGGAGSISYLQSRILSGGDDVDLIADYRVRPLFSLFGISAIPTQSRYYSHAWVGWSVGGELADHDREEEEQKVYVTAAGTVYHCDRNCTYLRPSIQTTDAAALLLLRNRSGEKYYPCEICHPAAAGQVLITRDGNRYHGTSTCSGIKRSVREVPLSAVEGTMAACSKCGK